MDSPLFGNTDNLHKLLDLKGQIDNLFKGVQYKLEEIRAVVTKLDVGNIRKITTEILEINESTPLKVRNYPGFQNLNIQYSIEYLTDQIYDRNKTFSILHFFDVDETKWSEVLRINLFRTLRSIFNKFYQFYSASYLTLEMTQEAELIMVDMKFKGCGNLSDDIRIKQAFESLNFLVQKMHGNFTLNQKEKDQIDIIMVVPLYV